MSVSEDEWEFFSFLFVPTLWDCAKESRHYKERKELITCHVNMRVLCFTSHFSKWSVFWAGWWCLSSITFWLVPEVFTVLVYHNNRYCRSKICIFLWAHIQTHPSYSFVAQLTKGSSLGELKHYEATHFLPWSQCLECGTLHSCLLYSHHTTYLSFFNLYIWETVRTYCW